jgi:hypothetical protein
MRVIIRALARRRDDELTPSSSPRLDDALSPVG